MNIVVTDAHTCNPGDLSWDKLHELGQTTIYQRSSRDELPSRIADADILVVNKVICNGELLDWAPRLKLIAITATGYNTIDLEACRERGVTVCSVPAYSTPDVIQHTFALLLELTNHVGIHAASVMDGEWVTSPDFCYWLAPLTELKGKTMGIVGMGSIGQGVATVARAFGMEVVFCNRSPKPEFENQGMRQVELGELLGTADVVSLHAPATAQTASLINAQTLSLMKDGAFLINTARGALVDETAVVAALRSGKLAGYGADVAMAEPMPADDPILSCRDLNVAVTPHIAWATHEARGRLMDVTIANVLAFLNGTPQNVVS